MTSKVSPALWSGASVLVLVGILTLSFQSRWYQSSQMPQASGEVVLQRSPADCGPAALATIARHYNLDFQPQDIAKLAGTTDAGTTLYGLAQAANQMGLEATGMELSLIELQSAPLPLVAHVNGNHFVVVQSFEQDRLTLLDSAVGRREIDASAFQQIWKGYVLLIQPPKADGD